MNYEEKSSTITKLKSHRYNMLLLCYYNHRHNFLRITQKNVAQSCNFDAIIGNPGLFSNGDCMSACEFEQ